MNPEEAARARNAQLLDDDAPLHTEPLTTSSSLPEVKVQDDTGLPAMKSRLSTSANSAPIPPGSPSLALSATKLSADKAASFYDDSLHLDSKVGEDGLIYKAICKTGTLALSPGPGQIDVDEPLELTQELFENLVESVEEQAFPYVTIPRSHGNDMLENTGFVRKLSIEDSPNPNDPPGTKVLWAGMQFTEPDIKAMVERGTIPDTSVGVKFNYRNKRTGKTYPAALEHVALTHQPWVDGLTPFGQDKLLSIKNGSEPVDENDYMGVYVHVDKAADKSDGEADKIKTLASKWRKSGDKSEGDILPHKENPGRMPSTLQASQRERKMKTTKTRSTNSPSVEKLLASQQARLERAEAENKKLRNEVKLAQGSIQASAEALHLSEVQSKVKEWQDAGVPPAICTFAHDCLLAAGPEREDGAVLTLSIESGDTVEEKNLSISGIVEEFVAKVPKIGSGDIGKIVREMDELNMSQTDGKSGAARGEEMYEQTKKRIEGQ